MTAIGLVYRVIVVPLPTDIRDFLSYRKRSPSLPFSPRGKLPGGKVDSSAPPFVVVVCPCRSNVEHRGLLSEVSMVMCVDVVSDQTTDRTILM